MEKRMFGKTGMMVTVLGLGAAEIGFNGVPQETVGVLVNEALDAGLNVIDTAECYANSEELLGNAVSHRRGEYFLFTKCGHDGKSFGMPDWDPKMLALSIDRSLQRLKTDRVDLLQIHSCSEEMLKQGDVVAVVEKAKAAGKARFIGYSGDSHAAKHAVQMGVFDALQTSVNIADQEAIDLTLELAMEKEMGVIAKRPLANMVWNAKVVPSYQMIYWDRLKKLDYGFLKGTVSVGWGISLRFTLSCQGVATAIVGTGKPGRWKENAAMLGNGAVSSVEFNEIRVLWAEVAGKEWVGQV